MSCSAKETLWWQSGREVSQPASRALGRGAAAADTASCPANGEGLCPVFSGGRSSTQNNATKQERLGVQPSACLLAAGTLDSSLPAKPASQPARQPGRHAGLLLTSEPQCMLPWRGPSFSSPLAATRSCSPAPGWLAGWLRPPAAQPPPLWLSGGLQHPKLIIFPESFQQHALCGDDMKCVALAATA